MVKHTTYTCDRCQKVILNPYEQVLDFLKAEYPGMDICTDCDLLIVLGSSLTKRDLANNSKLGTSLKLMLDKYTKEGEV